MSHSLTLVLSDDVYRYLREVADLTRQPLAELVSQSVKGNLPPRPADAPVEMRSELLAMQTMSDSELRQIAASQIAPEQQLHHQNLLDKNSEGNINALERTELAALRLNADQLMVRKAYAWSLLRWRGHSLPARNDIPVA